MIIISDPKNCCGCSACESICPHKAISMQPDVLGFLYPVVDKNKCTNCNLCNEVCAFNENYKKNIIENVEVYAVRHKEITEIDKSRSGAMFTAITDYIIKNGGSIYGAGYKEHFIVIHKRATTREERDEFRGSKYVQSELNGIFDSVRKDLKDGLLVCFSGTPCQTAGLRSFLERKRTDTTNLVVVDIVCHGVPSPYIWRDYLSYIEKKNGGTATAIDFRDKLEFGWTAHLESFTISGKKVATSTYTTLFYKHIMFRHSCGNCHYTNTHRPSDITIADFWGWENVDAEFNKDDKGVSLVLINSTKGKEIFNKIKDNIHVIKTDIDHAMQPNLQCPSSISPQRLAFEKEYKHKGFLFVMKKYGKTRKRNKFIEMLQKIKWNIKHRILKS